MNIIQQQDRLKSLPEEVLIEYIANPTGEVPTFLALGEIERRKVMRNKYAAQQAEQPPVAEQIVQESMTARMPRPMDMVGGLGRSNRQEALRRETAPPMAPSGDAGITALPTPNVGQNYARGGVVGYAVGGSTDYDDYTRALTFSDDAGSYTEEGMIVDDEGITFDPLSNNAGPNVYEGIKAEQAALADVFGLQSSEDFYGAEREAIQAERDKYAGDKDSALNMALINAGLGIAGGTSSNALENIASGAQTGVASYTKDLKDIRDEDRLFNKELRSLDRLRRAEGRADLTEYRANELALQKLLQKSGLSTAESATIIKDAREDALKTIDKIYKNGIKDAPGDTLEQKESNYYKALDNLTRNRFTEMINARVMPSVSIGDTTGYSVKRL